ncbi:MULTISPECIES: hypothetical protein [unclassified Novosphingobium]|uniref:hypothetical protein n=1 Tax=unclassified Novosphingobium TaxID=2644732 RepID=UPI0025F77B71|nr:MULTISPECIES: hypothetical protein [unclassified Novosphingobium]
MLTDAESTTLRNLEKAIRELRTAIDPNVPTQVVHAFLMVAQDEGQTLSTYAHQLGTNISTASRHFLDLGDQNRKLEKGYMLIDRKADPRNLRINRYFLTTKGRLLIKSLVDIREG